MTDYLALEGAMRKALGVGILRWDDVSTEEIVFRIVRGEYTWWEMKVTRRALLEARSITMFQVAASRAASDFIDYLLSRVDWDDYFYLDTPSGWASLLRNGLMTPQEVRDASGYSNDRTGLRGTPGRREKRALAGEGALRWCG